MAYQGVVRTSKPKSAWPVKNIKASMDTYARLAIAYRDSQHVTSHYRSRNARGSGLLCALQRLLMTGTKLGWNTVASEVAPGRNG